MAASLLVLNYCWQGQKVTAGIKNESAIFNKAFNKAAVC
jgi:hypothetical protein